MDQFDHKIDHLLSLPPYGQSPAERHAGLLEILRQEVECACWRHAGYRNYVQHWPVDYHSATQLADLPYLPVGILKANPPLSFVGGQDVKTTLTSSATTSQLPSRVVLDAPTSRRMTKGIMTIVRAFHRFYASAVSRCGHTEFDGRRERAGRQGCRDSRVEPVR